MHIVEDNIVNFPDNYEGIYCSKPDKNILGKWLKRRKINMIEGLNFFQTVGGNKKGFIEPPLQ